MVHAVIARAKKVKLGISNDFWKAQTMLFHEYQHENLCTCLLHYVKTVLKSAFSGEKLPGVEFDEQVCAFLDHIIYIFNYILINCALVQEFTVKRSHCLEY